MSRLAPPLLVLAIVMAPACGRLGFEPVSSPGSSAVGVGPVDFTTVSPSFVPVTTLTFTPTSAGEAWLLLVSAELSGEGAEVIDPAAEARYVVNGFERGLGQADGAVGSHAPWIQFDLVTGTIEPQTVVVELRRIQSAATITNLRLVAFPLALGADSTAWWSELELAQPIGTFADYLSLSVDPSEPGDYLVLAQATATEDPSQGVFEMQVIDPVGATWPTDLPFGNDRSPFHPFFLARVVHVEPTAGAVFTIQLAGPTGQPCTARSIRMLGFRTDAFGSFATTADLDLVASASSAPTVTSQLLVASAAARTFVVIQSMSVYIDMDLPVARGLRFVREGVAQASYSYFSDAADQRLSYGMVSLVTGDQATTYENAFYSPTGAALTATESVIHVIGLAR